MFGKIGFLNCFCAIGVRIIFNSNLFTSQKSSVQKIIRSFVNYSYCRKNTYSFSIIDLLVITRINNLKGYSQWLLCKGKASKDPVVTSFVIDLVHCCILFWRLLASAPNASKVKSSVHFRAEIDSVQGVHQYSEWVHISYTTKPGWSIVGFNVTLFLPLGCLGEASL